MPCLMAAGSAALTLLDVLTREALAIEVDKGITGGQVAAILDTVLAARPAPQRIRVDNGPEFVSNALDRWAYEHGVTLDFSRRANRSTMPSSTPSTVASARSV